MTWSKYCLRAGYNVFAASRPGEAIRMVKKYGSEIDLLLTDMIMPEMNGLELAKQVASLWPDVKRLFMSGYSSDVIANQVSDKERLPFIHKPF